RPDDHGAVPGSLARRNRDKTLEECAGCGRVTGESDQPTGGGVAAWEIALCVDAGAAHAASAGGQLGSAGSRAGGHLVAPLGHAQRRASTDDYRRLVLEGGRLGGMPEGVGGTTSPEEITTAASRSDRHTLSPRGKQTRGCAHGSITTCYQGEPMLILARMGILPGRVATGGSLLPFPLRGQADFIPQARAQPAAEGHCIVPGDILSRMIILLAILLARLCLMLCQPSPPALLAVAILPFEETAVLCPGDGIFTDRKRLHGECPGIVFEGNFPSR